MCGIIGYVGSRACQAVLLEGLRRLEYRGYDSAGIAWREDGLRGDDPIGREPRRAPGGAGRRWRRGAGRDRDCCARSAWGSATPAGPRTEGSPRATRTLTRTPAAGSGSSSTGSSRTTSSCASGWPPIWSAFTSDTDAEVVAHLIALNYDGRPGRRRPAVTRRAGRPLRVGRDVRRRARHAGRRQARVPAGGRDSVTVSSSSPRRSRRSCAYTREIAMLADGEIVDAARRTGSSVAGADGAAASLPLATAVEWDRTRARRTASRRSCSRRSTSRPTRSGDAGARGAPTAQQDANGRARCRRACATSSGSSSWRAARRTTRAWPAATRSSGGLGCPSTSRSRRSSATAIRSSAPRALVLGITQSGETADTLAAMRLARDAGRDRAGGDQRRWKPGDAGLGRRAVHPRRTRDRRRRDEDVRRSGRAAV